MNIVFRKKNKSATKAAAFAFLMTAFSNCFAAAITPTVSELLNAANCEYIINGIPAGMAPFTVNNIQVTRTNNITGMSAKAWVTAENQIIIAYQGTSGGQNALINPTILAPQVFTDLQAMFTGTTPAAFYDAVDFARQVVAYAQQQGHSADDVFVTGHSLGGMEAEYVAQQLGLDGIGFESTGIRPAASGNGVNSGFVNTATYGDPVGNFGSDINAEQPFSPPYDPANGGLPHYGGTVMLGNLGNQGQLAMLGWYWRYATPLALADFTALFLKYHFPGVQAYQLGVTLNPFSATSDSLGDISGPVLNVAQYTIPQFIQAAQASGRWVAP